MTRGYVALLWGLGLFAVTMYAAARMGDRVKEGDIRMELGYARADFDPTGFLTLRQGRKALLRGGLVELSYDTFQSAAVPLMRATLATGEGMESVTWAASTPVADLSVEYLFRKDLPLVTVRWQTEYKKPDLIGHERLFFESPCSPAFGFSRESVWRRLYGTHWFTEFVRPYVSLGSGERAIHLIGHNTFALTRLLVDAPSVQMDFFADSSQAHPFMVFLHRAKIKREDNCFISRQLAVPGLKRTNEVSFWIGRRPVFFRKELQPGGARATIVFSEHADESLLEGNLALYFGTSDARSPDFGKRGIVGHGLRTTKTVFFTQLQNPDFKAMMDRLYRQGVEIGPHTMAPGRDGDLLDVGLRFFQEHYQSRTWIDHGPIAGPGTDTSNEEDLAVLGWSRESPHYVLERLERHGYAYAWNCYEQDWPHDAENGVAFNMLYGSRSFVPPWIVEYPYEKRPGHEILPRLLFYNNRLDPNPLDEKKLFLFVTYPYSRAQRPGGFAFLYNTAMVGGLVEDRGVHVAHCYLASKMNHGVLFHPRGGHWEIDGEFEARLANLGRHVRNGDLWNPTIAEWGDYLTRVLPAIRIDYLTGESCRVTNEGAPPVSGLTLAIRAKPDERVTCSKGHRVKRVDGDWLLSLDLSPGEHAEVQLVRGAAQDDAGRQWGGQE